MKALVLAVLLLAPIGALAASPEDDYIAARDRDIAELKTLLAAEVAVRDSDIEGLKTRELAEDAAARRIVEEKDAKDLEQRLKTLIGPFAAAGFLAEGKLNAPLYDLYGGYPSFSEIDGLVYGDKDDDNNVIVTTDGLFDEWLLSLPRRLPKNKAPRSAAAAAGTETFYTEDVNRGGSAVARYAIVPIVAPPGAKFAKAMLATSDVGPEIPETPDRLFVALEKAGRVFIVHARPATPMKAIPACYAVLRTYEAKADVAAKANTNAMGHPKLQEKLEKLANKVSDQGQAAFLSCFSDKIKTTPEFEAAKKQATAIVEALARN